MIRARLAAEKRRIEALARKRGFRNLRIFGSVARGEADDSSNVDLLVDAAEGTSLIDLIGLQRELQDLLGLKVDVVTPAGLPEDIRTRALAEAQAL
jgi:predicted nucleotidyltransferase